jgi:hypothetical protein
MQRASNLMATTIFEHQPLFGFSLFGKQSLLSFRIFLIQMHRLLESGVAMQPSIRTRL